MHLLLLVVVARVSELAVECPADKARERAILPAGELEQPRVGVVVDVRGDEHAPVFLYKLSHPQPLSRVAKHLSMLAGLQQEA